MGEHVREVHDGYRSKLRQVLQALDDVRSGASRIGDARGVRQQFAIRADDWGFGGLGQRQCFALTEHHHIEDDGLSGRAGDHVG